MVFQVIGLTSDRGRIIQLIKIPYHSVMYIKERRHCYYLCIDSSEGTNPIAILKVKVKDYDRKIRPIDRQKLTKLINEYIKKGE